MHFLCLHGMGTSNHVFETQFATLRYEMDSHHTFDFAEGTVVHPIAQEIRDLFPSKDTYYCYYKLEPDSVTAALEQLEAYIEAEGPFDGVLTFSQGGCLIATYLLHLARQTPVRAPPFRCVVFLSCTNPFDPEALYERRELRRYKAPEKEEEEEPTTTTTTTATTTTAAAAAIISIPTTHIWGKEDLTYGAESEAVSKLCDPASRICYVHAGGHEIPGPRAKDDVQGSIRAVRRTIDMAERAL